MNSTYLIPSTDVRIQELPKTGRRLRKSTNDFQVAHKPFEIQPFLLAPVLPGETMKNLLFQGSAMTDAINNGNFGWWDEYYFFYVKLRDLAARTTLEQMLIANGPPPAADGADPRCFYAGEGINFARMCLDRVVETYFRSEEEVASAINPKSSANMPKAKLISNPGWMENLVADGDNPASDGTPLPGDHYPALPDHLSAFTDAYAQWQQMQSLQLTPPSFEDYLKTFGIRPPPAAREEKHIPELIRYVREFTKPQTKMVGGTASTRVVWDHSERADKDRFFSEPGFVFGVTTTRAKMFASYQTANMASFMNDAYAWLPALLRPDPFTSLKKFAFGGSGPLANQTEDYWVDMADVLMGGDQFLAPANAVVANNTQSPTEQGQAIDISKDYCSDANVLDLFAVGANSWVHKEGRVDLNVLTALEDTTP